MKVSALCSIYIKTQVEELELSLLSLFSGNIKPSETIIVFDGPVKDSVNQFIINNQRNFMIKTVILNINKGLGYALNSGLRICSNDIICRFDSDDINLFPNKKTFVIF